MDVVVFLTQTKLKLKEKLIFEIKYRNNISIKKLYSLGSYQELKISWLKNVKVFRVGIKNKKLFYGKKFCNIFNFDV